MRTYEKTHPWINFSADLSRAQPKLWIMLGECQSKCLHLAQVPLRPSTARELLVVYLAKGIQATTAIEGNTLTEQEVRKHIEGKLVVGPSREYLKQEVDNILQACNKILETVSRREPIALSPDGIGELNAMVLKNLSLGEDVLPGEVRSHSVVVGAVYRGAPPEDCSYLFEKLCHWLESEVFTPPEDMRDYRIAFAILEAVLAHLYLAWIHPFGDGNGRTARLVEFQILLASGVPAPAAHLLSNHYNQTKTEYYRQLDCASKSHGEVLPFLEYAVQGFLDCLKEQLERIWQQQYDIAWRNYVHESFRDKAGEVSTRRRHLVLDLSTRDRSVSRNDIPQLTPRLARAYANKTGRTLSRDLNALCKMALVEQTPDGFRARKETILAYLPPQADG